MHAAPSHQSAAGWSVLIPHDSPLPDQNLSAKPQIPSDQSTQQPLLQLLPSVLSREGICVTASMVGLIDTLYFDSSTKSPRASSMVTLTDIFRHVGTSNHKILREFRFRLLQLATPVPNQLLLSMMLQQRLLSLARTATPRRAANDTEFPSLIPSGIKLSPRALITVTLVLANKVWCDRQMSNRAWAEIAEIDVAVLNIAERECLAALAYKVHVSDAEFAEWVHGITPLFMCARDAAIWNLDQTPLPVAAP